MVNENTASSALLWFPTNATNLGLSFLKFFWLSRKEAGIDSRFTMMYKEQAYGNVFPPYPHLSPSILSFFLLIAYILTSHSLTLILIVIMKSFLISALLTFGCHGCFALDRTTEASEASITGRFQLGFKFHEARSRYKHNHTSTHRSSIRVFSVLLSGFGCSSSRITRSLENCDHFI